jgi:UDP-GlcNAc:undecaprenyl-phosphate GlcNAc-1-phosphate transferase
MSDWAELYVAVFMVAFVTSLGVGFVLLRLAPRAGLIDSPGNKKFHYRATPLGGGLAMFLASTGVLLFEPLRVPTTWILVTCGALLTLIGLLDDFRSVPATVKFALLVVMTLVLWQFGIGAHPTRVEAIDLLITVLWITGVSSAFNAIDNMDGLATGVTTIAAGTFLVVALQTGQWVFGGLCAGLVGASLGFLVYNFPPARMFMGDAGSFFLGFTLASLGIVGEWNENQVIAAVIPILVLGLPLYDLSFTVLARHLTGVTRTLVDAINHCDADHVSHRLVKLGLSTRSAVLVLYLIAASFGVSAVSLQHAVSWVGLLHLLQALVLASALALVIAAVPPAAVARPRAAGTPDPAPSPIRAWLPLWAVVAALAALLAIRLSP